MIKITKTKDLEFIHDSEIRPYISNLLNQILSEYKRFCPDSSTDDIGAIFLLESESDYVLYSEMGLSTPLAENRFEWIESIENGRYCNGCIVIDNDRAVNIIGRKEYFERFTEDAE